MNATARLGAAIVVGLGVLIRATGVAADEGALASCDAEVARHHDALEPYECYRAAARHDGSFDESLARLHRILAREPDNHRARLIVAHLDNELGRPAEVHYRAAAEQAAKARDRRVEVEARMWLIGLLFRGQRPAEGATQLALAAGAARGSQVLTAMLNTGQALAAEGQGNHARALAFLEAAAPHLFPDGPAWARAIWLGTKGAASWALGLSGAFAAYSRQVDLFVDTGDRYEESGARLNLLLVGQSVGMSADEQRHQAQLAVAAARATHHVGPEGRAYFYLAEFSQGDEALDYARRSLAIARQVKDRAAIYMGLRAVASHLAPSDPVAAYRCIDEAIEAARQEHDTAEVARNLTVRSRMSWKTGPRDQAIRDSLAALDAVESDRAVNRDTLIRARRFSAWRVDYDTVAGHVLNRDLADSHGPVSREDIALAFQLMERRRARMLLDTLNASGLKSVTRRAGTVSLDQLAQQLNPDQAILSFQLAWRAASDGTFHGDSWLIAIGPEHLHVYRLPDFDRLRSEVQMTLGLFGRHDGSENRGTVRLYDDLLRQALADLPPSITKLVIVPDTPLESVPFDALGPSPGEPLAMRYEISVVPSATLWLRWKNEKVTAGTAPVLALADPDLSRTLSRSSQKLREDLAPLPYARREGRAVVRSLGGESEVRVGSEATEDALKQNGVGRFGIIHFATHAIVDTDSPDRSAIVLAAGPSGEDGWLRPAEIAALPLAGKVVVLSGCGTAGGTVVGGEGLVGLAHAFFEAGAHTVVATVWPMRDSEASAFFERFYANLRDEPRVGPALTRTRRSAIAAGIPAGVWSAAVLIGDADAAPARSRASTPGISLGMLAVAIAVLLCAAWAIRSRTVVRFRDA